ncbi:Histone deacetylase 8 [Mortierella sp. GBA30]|nr:Histone deacetylase 8 [Mortierella sp. GBA30]
MSSSKSARRLAYIYNKEYADLAALLPSNLDRSKRVHALINAYGLLQLRDLTIVSPRKATLKELCRYHSRDYIEFLKSVEEDSDPLDEEEQDENGDNRGRSKEDKLEEYGLQYDCAVFEGIADYAAYVAGSSIEAATLLNDDVFDIVIHWDGGRHHAKKDMAAGFCIVNDIVLGIMELQKSYDRIMYIDLDVHHGDGVENAFQFTDKVLTVSLHHFAEGFYPGTGSGSTSTTVSKRTKAVVNIPLRPGLSGVTMLKIFEEMVEPLYRSYNPEAIVMQCGVDGMTGDPLGKWNLTIQSYGECVQRVMAWKKPLLLLGGGGYKSTSAARCYAYLTSILLDREIYEDIPEHEYFEEYEPDFLLHVDPGRQADENTTEYLAEVKELVGIQSEIFSKR